MKSFIQWAISNGPAMNIVMIAVMLVGAVCFQTLNRETFPEFETDVISVSVAYPGAAPEEVEEGICQKIEESVRSVSGIQKVTSTASEGVGSVSIELRTDVSDRDRILNDVRSAVDRISTMPELAEDPEVKLAERSEQVIKVGVLGPKDDSEQAHLSLRKVAEDVREDLLQLPSVSEVNLSGDKDYQIDIEVSEDALQAYGLTIQQIAEAVRRENNDTPGGTIRSKSQEVLLRGHNRRLTGEEIASHPLVTQPDGAVLTVGDLCTVRDGFSDTTAVSEVDGHPVLVLSVMRNPNEDLLGMVDKVYEYVESTNLPPGFRLQTWGDRSIEVRGRIDLLVKNSWQGLIVVFLVLAAFLELRLAFWIAMGIPFSLLASAAWMLLTGQTLNMISMFAFVMALGIVVDDAIVVGENIYAHRQMGKSTLQAAIDGAVEVVPSVMASVSTTVIAFMPLLFVSGMLGKIIYVLPTVVIAMLVVSLIECMTILPCHLSHVDSVIFHLMRRVFYAVRWMMYPLMWLNRFASAAMQFVIVHLYRPALHWVMHHRVIFLAGCASAWILAIGLVSSGRAPFIFFPKLDSTSIRASVTFPDGTPESVTAKAVHDVEAAFWRAADRMQSDQGSVAQMSYITVGSQTGDGPPGQSSSSTTGNSHLGSVEVELVDPSFRSYTSDEISSAWRDEVSDIPGIDSLTFGASFSGPGGTPIEFRLTANREGIEHLDEAVERCKEKLAAYPGVFDVADDSSPGKWEFRLRVKDNAVATGVKAADLAETVRATYYGQEVMRLQRGRHEVKLMVRYPKEDRQSLANFDDLRIRSDDGSERPLRDLAQVNVVRGYSKIERIDQQRCITISADVEETTGNAREIVSDLKSGFLPELLAEHPGLRVRWGGQQEQQADSFQSMVAGFGIALMAMFVLLAFEFKSYMQPLIILAIIPFGLVGAIAGHALLGLPITIFSIFGLVALTGIIINDSIVLVDFINQLRESGVSDKEALLQAGQRRFRPVMLTTLTTVGGLTPILLETSFQAQMLIPMATSVAFGEIFATILVLLLVPVLYSVYLSLPNLMAIESHPPETSPTTAPSQPQLAS
ncbi:efflux RND transporter permease subunit [Rhodopirellula bahusiensis]|uniref:Multidrug transporter n=2 Tax=Rhodopirellula bahusiensis TaxID=2014065 RepID=A0A2G1VZL2_9BACT|nr:efflux RND transporter permease subunit [Rhodopirellula bahusiensis]PHQ32236.1 multidrug transporter [Rhodopirellula bahusiensis]